MALWNAIRRNLSMLTVTLLRSWEQPIWQSTAAWIRTDERNVFTLVVDELHM